MAVIERVEERQNLRYKNTIDQFKKIIEPYILCKVFFFTLFLLETLFLGLFFPFFTQSSLVALTIGCVALSLFSYFVLLFYFQAKKPEMLDDLHDRFVESSRQLIAVPKGAAEHHLSIAQSLLRLVSNLQEVEYTALSLPSWINVSSLMKRKLSSFFYKDEVRKMKEKLLLTAIVEHIEQIKQTPVDLEVHASLANVYLVFAKLYEDELKAERLFPGFSSSKLQLYSAKFSFYADRAIEELRILTDYAPNDPWVHSQLASCYRTLNKKEEEALEYEKILKLSPNDNEVFFRLGVISFELGQNAKGLKIFEELKKRKHQKTTELLSFYGATHSFDTSFET